MIETIVSGVILAAISVMGFIAYKHPKGYVRIMTRPVNLLTGGSFGLIIASISNIYFNAESLQKAKEGEVFTVFDISNISSIINSVELILWVVGITIIMHVYHFILLNLHEFLADDS